VLTEAPAPAPALVEPAPTAEPARPRARSKPSADERLAAAQDALAEGHADEAIARYETLITEYPTSKAAAIARVSLGRLLLRQGRTRDALAAFDAYLAGDDRELAEEAEYGRIKALHALGERAELAAAIDAFLAAHADSIHRGKLDTWRQELEGSRPDRP
jgi:tetratricopeptide (TPR) repeat protein